MALALTPIGCSSARLLLSRNKQYFNPPTLFQRGSNSIHAPGILRAASENQEPVKVETPKPAAAVDEAAEETLEEEELTEWEKSLGKFFRSRLWFIFLGCFFVGLYAFFITSNNGASYIPMMRYQYTYQR